MAVKHLSVASLSKGPFTVDESSSIVIDPSVKFKTTYSLARIDKGVSFKVKYLTERWHWFNKECFGSVMTLPVIVCTNTAKNPKTLGFWRGSTRELNIAYKMLALPNDAQVLGVLLHEMCHQYEAEIIKPPRAEFILNKMHGPNWASTMRAVGMPPDITFVGDVEVLLDQTQKDNLVKKRSGQTELKPSQRLVGLTPKHFNTDGFMYALQVTKTGDLVPVIVLELIVGPADDDPSYVGFRKSDLAQGRYAWGFHLSEMLKPTPTQLKKFPPEFFSVSTLKRILTRKNRHNGNP